MRCTICHEEDDTVKSLHSEFEHMFHPRCFVEWTNITNEQNCPLCSLTVSNTEFYDVSERDVKEVLTRAEKGELKELREVLQDAKSEHFILSMALTTALRENSAKAAFNLCLQIDDILKIQSILSGCSGYEYGPIFSETLRGITKTDVIFIMSIYYHFKELSLYSLEQGANPIFWNGNALPYAVVTDDIAYVEKLIYLGCPYIVGGFPLALWAAARIGSLPLVKLFHQLGSDIYSKDQRALYLAKCGNHENVIEYLSGVHSPPPK